MDETRQDFASVFKAFVPEAVLAFPTSATAMLDASMRYEEDPGVAEAEFAEDVGPLMRSVVASDPMLLDRLGETRLFRGFRVPEDAHEANKAQTLNYTVQLMSMAWTKSLVPEDRMEGLLESVRRNDVFDGDELDMKKLLTSEQGLQLTADVAAAMGLDVDMRSPEARQAMALMQMLF